MRPRPPALHLHIATYPVAVMLVVPTTSLVFGRPSDLSEDTEEELPSVWSPATRHDCLGLAGPATSTLVHASVISLARTDTYLTPYSAVALGSRRMERSCPAPGADATQPSANALVST